MIAISSPAFSVLDFGEALDRIASEFKAWEIVAEGSHDLRDIEARFLELTPSYRLEFSVHAPMSDINIGSLNPRMREASVRELIACLGACHRMGIETITVHPAFLTPLAFVSRDRMVEATRSSLRRLEAMSRELGIRVALENMPRSPHTTANTPEGLLELLEGSELGICLDVGHAHTAAALDGFLKLKKRIINLHVHDNNGQWDEHLPVGEGTIDWPRLLRSLKGYKGRYVIESKGLDDGVISKRRLEAMMS